MLPWKKGNFTTGRGHNPASGVAETRSLFKNSVGGRGSPPSLGCGAVRSGILVFGTEGHADLRVPHTESGNEIKS